MSLQLLDPGYEPPAQTSMGQEGATMPRFVVKLHRAACLHFDFRLELFGRLLSFVVRDLTNCWVGATQAVRVADYELRSLLDESSLPSGSILVWDHGVYCSQGRTLADAYRRLQAGRFEFELHGVRLNGVYRLTGRGELWQLKRITGSNPERVQTSVLTGRTLDDIAEPVRGPVRVWAEWEHFYTEPSTAPQVAVREGRVADMNLLAKSQGVAVGMRLQHVLPLVPGCEVIDFKPRPDRQRAWLDLLVPYTDTIQPFDDHSAAFDLSAHPDPRHVAGEALGCVASRPFGHLRYGAGPSVWIAQLAALQRNPFGYLKDPAGTLATQPVENLLAVPAQDRERLVSLGFKVIGEVAAVPPATLRAQFGEGAHRMVAAAQARTHDHVKPLYPPGQAVESFTFPAPIDDALSLQEAVRLLAGRLTAKIAGRQAGATILAVEQEDGTTLSLNRTYSRPLHTEDRVFASMTYLAGELQKSCPGIVRLTARLDQLEPLKSSQQDLYIATTCVDSKVALSTLRESFGAQSVVLASQIATARREQVLKAWRDATGWK